MSVEGLLTGRVHATCIVPVYLASERCLLRPVSTHQQTSTGAAYSDHSAASQAIGARHATPKGIKCAIPTPTPSAGGYRRAGK